MTEIDSSYACSGIHMYSWTTFLTHYNQLVPRMLEIENIIEHYNSP